AQIDDGGHGEFLTFTAALKTAAHSAPVLAVLSYPLAEAVSAYRSILPPVLLVLTGALFLAAAGAMLVVRSASRPLETLAAAARRIARGDDPPPEPVGQKDEIGELSGALIGMTKSIA